MRASIRISSSSSVGTAIDGARGIRATDLRTSIRRFAVRTICVSWIAWRSWENALTASVTSSPRLRAVRIDVTELL